MTGKAARVTLWPQAAQVLGSLLDRYESAGHACFEDGYCEYIDDCDNKRAQACKFGQQFQKVKARLHRAGYP